MSAERRTDSRPTARRGDGKVQLIWTLLGVLTCALCAAFVLVFLNSPVFLVDRVLIDGNHRLSERDVFALTGLEAPRNVLTLRANSMRVALERDPWIRAAAVDVSWDGTVVVEIEEREMVAAAALGDGFVGLDDDGREIAEVSSLEALSAEFLVVGYSTIDAPESAAFVAGRAIAEADAWNRHAGSLGRIVELQLDVLRGTTWVLADGVAVQWNEPPNGRRLEVLRQTLSQSGAARGRIERIEFLTAEDEVLVLLNDGRQLRGELARRQR